MLEENEPIEVGPMVEYFEGGIVVNERFETGVEGLYAAGECTLGAFGANRVFSAITEMLVHGLDAGESAADYAQKATVPEPDDKILKIVSVDNGDSREVATVEGVNIHNELTWSPDSKRIAFNGPDEFITVISIKDGSIEEIKTDLLDVEIYHFDWSPDGDRFVFAGYQGGDSEFWLMENFLPLSK